MADDVDDTVVAQLRVLAEDLKAQRTRALALADNLSPQSPSPPESEEPESGPALVASRLRCIVKDWLDNAIRDLSDLLRGAETP